MVSYRNKGQAAEHLLCRRDRHILIMSHYVFAGMSPSPPPELTTCLGDLFSVAFLENWQATPHIQITFVLQLFCPVCYLIFARAHTWNGTNSSQLSQGASVYSPYAPTPSHASALYSTLEYLFQLAD